MDTGTVLEIIAMLDARITHSHLEEEVVDARGDEHAYYNGERDALRDIKNHLQKHIDSLQNQVENEMNRGD